jgi:hypothetical protein
METNETIVTKTCKICGETKPITSFTLNYEKKINILTYVKYVQKSEKKTEIEFL